MSSAAEGSATDGSDCLSLTAFERLESSDDFRDELVRGRLVREPPPASRHGWLQFRVASMLGTYTEAAGLGLVLVETGFILADDPPTVRAPDVAFIAHERATGYPSDRYGRTPPDLAIEIVSPSDSASALIGKVFDYLDAAMRLVWVIDPASRSVTIYQSREDVRMIGTEGELGGGDVLPGLRISLTKLFDG